MKKKCLVAATLILLSQTTLLALDTLSLHIPVLNSARIRLQLNANTPMGNQARMEMASANWVLKISNAARAKITLSNTEPGSDPVTFEDMVAVFEVKNNVLTARNFKFNKHFQFSIAGADNVVIKKYTIVNEWRRRARYRRSQHAPKYGGW
jgi:hypothetical protein